MTDTPSKPNPPNPTPQRRWSRKAIPVGLAVLVALGVTTGPALATTPAAHHPTRPARAAASARTARDRANGPSTHLVPPTGRH